MSRLTTPGSVEDEKQGAASAMSGKDGANTSNRWDFIQGDTAMHNSKNAAKSTSACLYRRKLQKRLMHHKQHLLDLQQAKKNFMTSQMEKSAAAGAMPKEAESLVKNSAR